LKVTPRTISTIYLLKLISGNVYELTYVSVALTGVTIYASMHPTIEMDNNILKAVFLR